MALFDTADGESFDGFVQVVEQCKFLPRRHTPDEFDLDLLHFGVSIGIQGAHDFSIAQPGILPLFVRKIILPILNQEVSRWLGHNRVEVTNS